MAENFSFSLQLIDCCDIFEFQVWKNHRHFQVNDAFFSSLKWFHIQKQETNPWMPVYWIGLDWFIMLIALFFSLNYHHFFSWIVYLKFYGTYAAIYNPWSSNRKLEKNMFISQKCRWRHVDQFLNILHFFSKFWISFKNKKIQKHEMFR